MSSKSSPLEPKICPLSTRVKFSSESVEFLSVNPRNCAILLVSVEERIVPSPLFGR